MFFFFNLIRKEAGTGIKAKTLNDAKLLKCLRPEKKIFNRWLNIMDLSIKIQSEILYFSSNNSQTYHFFQNLNKKGSKEKMGGGHSIAPKTICANAASASP